MPEVCGCDTSQPVPMRHQRGPLVTADSLVIFSEQGVGRDGVGCQAETDMDMDVHGSLNFHEYPFKIWT